MEDVRQVSAPHQEPYLDKVDGYWVLYLHLDEGVLSMFRKEKGFAFTFTYPNKDLEVVTYNDKPESFDYYKNSAYREDMERLINVWGQLIYFVTPK